MFSLILISSVLSLARGNHIRHEYTGHVDFASLGSNQCAPGEAKTCYVPLVLVEIPIQSNNKFTFRKNCNTDLQCAIDFVNIGELPKYYYNSHTKRFSLKPSDSDSGSFFNIANGYVILTIGCTAIITWVLLCIIAGNKGNNNNGGLPEYHTLPGQSHPPPPPLYTPSVNSNEGQNTDENADVISINGERDNVSVNSSEPLIHHQTGMIEVDLNNPNYVFELEPVQPVGPDESTI